MDTFDKYWKSIDPQGYNTLPPFIPVSDEVIKAAQIDESELL